MTPTTAIRYRSGVMRDQRLQRFRQRMSDDGLDVAVLMPGANLHYLTGLRVPLSERPFLAFVAQQGPPRFLVPDLERSTMERELPSEIPVHGYPEQENGISQELGELASKLQLNRATVGVEYGRMRVQELRTLEAHVDPDSIVDLEPTAMALRQIKDATEIDALRRAVALTEDVLSAMVDAIEPGVTELDVVQAYERARIDGGSEAAPFSPVVASGPNSDSPHAHPSKRQLQRGDIITIDCGAVVDGYPGDITRNVALGDVDAERERIHQIVLDANAAGRKACRPGATAESVDRAARAVIDGAGYGEYFMHRTGHGMGLEVHEPPDIMEGNEQALRPGMVFTVEPGVYVPGVGGARIEDDMLITDGGAESLTRLPRELTRR